MEQKYEFEELSSQVIGAAIEVHKALKAGYSENIYHKALEIELAMKGVNFESEKDIKVWYKGEKIGDYKIDLLIDNKIVIELKVVENFCDAYVSQVLSYLKATQVPVGLLLNFSKSKLEIKRVLWTDK
jgi:GxxExxY protein